MPDNHAFRPLDRPAGHAYSGNQARHGQSSDVVLASVGTAQSQLLAFLASCHTRDPRRLGDAAQLREGTASPRRRAGAGVRQARSGTPQAATPLRVPLQGK